MSDSAETELSGIGKRHKNGAVSGNSWEHWLLPLKKKVQKAIFSVPLLYYHLLDSDEGHKPKLELQFLVLIEKMKRD